MYLNKKNSLVRNVYISYCIIWTTVYSNSSIFFHSCPCHQSQFVDLRAFRGFCSLQTNKNTREDLLPLEMNPAGDSFQQGLNTMWEAVIFCCKALLPAEIFNHSRSPINLLEDKVWPSFVHSNWSMISITRRDGEMEMERWRDAGKKNFLGWIPV